MKKNLNLIISIAALILGFVSGYFVRGYRYANQRPNFEGKPNFIGDNRGNNNWTGNGQGNQRKMGGAVMGEVTNVDDKSITVKMFDGSSKIIILAESTKYMESQESQKDKVKVGLNVSVIGQQNPDGSMTADTLQLSPLMLRTK